MASQQRRTARSTLNVIALDVSPAMLPLLPAVKDALSARYTHEMLINASTAEVALMAFGTKATSNLLNDEDRENFRHIVAPRGGEDGRALLEWVTPEAVFLPLEALFAAALADNAERQRFDGGTGGAAPPSRLWAADPLDVVLVAHKLLMKSVVEDAEDPEAAAAKPCPCSKTITVVVAGEEEGDYERGKAAVASGLTADAAVLLEGLGCKLRVLLVDPRPELRARGGSVAAAKKKKEKMMEEEEEGDESEGDDEDNSPQQLRLPAALEALIEALPRGRGLVRVQRVAGAVGLSGAFMEAPPPATTFWKGDLELARLVDDNHAAAAAAGGVSPSELLPATETRIPIKISRCVTGPETPKWLRMSSRPGEAGGIRLAQKTEYRRRSPEPAGGGGGNGGGKEQQQQQQQQQQNPPPREAKKAKAGDGGMDDAAACLNPLFENGGGGSGGGGGDDDDDDDNDNAAAAAAARRSLSPDAISKQERISCYRYGQELVPLDAAGEACYKLPAAALERSMLLLGFASPPAPHAIAEGAWVLTAGGAIPRPSRAKGAMAAANAGPGAGGSRAAAALSALARAAHRSGKVMVVRWVSKKGGNPKLYAGFPLLGEAIDDDDGGEGEEAEEKKLDLDGGTGKQQQQRRSYLSSPDCFVLVLLPFSDDVRHVRFPALDADEPRMPDAGQVAAAKALVRAWDLRGSGLFARAAVDGAEDGSRRKKKKKKGVDGDDDPDTTTIIGGAHPNPSRLRQLACAAGRTVAVIAAGEGGGGGGATMRFTVPEVGRGPGTGLLEPPAWAVGSRADAAARRLAEAFAGVL